MTNYYQEFNKGYQAAQQNLPYDDDENAIWRTGWECAEQLAAVDSDLLPSIDDIQDDEVECEMRAAFEMMRQTA